MVKPDGEAAHQQTTDVVPQEVPRKQRPSNAEEQVDVTAKLIKRFAKAKPTVDREDLQGYLEEAALQRETFLKLPFTIAFFCVFIISVLNHEDFSDSCMVQRHISGMLTGTTFEGIHYTSGHKDINDIDTQADIWLYFKEVVLPLFINPLGTPQASKHRVLRYNQIIGGLQIQQVRRERVNCASKYPDLGPFVPGTTQNPLLTNFSCYPWKTESSECFGAWTKISGAQQPEGFCPDSKSRQATLSVSSTGGSSGGAAHSHPHTHGGASARLLEFVPNGGGDGGSSKGARSNPGPDQLFSVYLLEREGLEQAQRKIAYLKNNNWIDENTAWVGVRLLVLNPDMGIFVHTTVGLYFPPSGAILPHVTSQSFRPEPYQQMYVIGLDCVWLLLLCWAGITLIREAVQAVRAKAFREFMMDGWKWLDALSVLGALTMIILWIVNLQKLKVAKNKAMAVREGELQNVADHDYLALVADLHLEMSNLSGYLMAVRVFLCWYTLLISMKFLESFSAQPRLAMVTNTMARAGIDLFHFLIVLVVIFMSYCVAGMFLFGRRVWEFSSLSRAVNTCFRMMLGDFDWDVLGEEHPTTAALWFWTYMIVMMLLMLNMLMAIIMDQYTEVKSDADESDPIWTQLYSMIMDRIHKAQGKSMSIDDVRHKVESMDDTEVDEDILLKAVGSDLPKEQAAELIQGALRRVDNALSKGVTISEAMRMIGWVKVAVQKIGWKLEEVMEQERDERSLLESDDLAAASKGISDAELDAGDPEQRMQSAELRIEKIEECLQGALEYITFRGKDVRNRLALIEDLLRNGTNKKIVANANKQRRNREL